MTLRMRNLHYIVGVIFFVLMLAYIHKFGTNIPFMDDWNNVRLVSDYISNSITVPALFHQHNESIMFFPKVLTLLISALTHFNIKTEMYVSASILFTSYCVLVYDYLDITINNPHRFWAFVPMAAVFFSLSEWANILWGFQIAWFVITFLLMVTLRSIRHVNSKLKLILPIACAVIASFSTIQGFLI